MLRKVTVLSVLISGVTFAFLVSFFPKFTGLFETGLRQLGSEGSGRENHNLCAYTKSPMHGEANTPQTSVQPVTFMGDGNKGKPI